MKKILIINGHPNKDSLCHALAQSYMKGVEVAKAECRLVNLIDLKFNPNLESGFHNIEKLEPDLKKMQQEILWADHLVFVYPTWWSTYPALLKGFIDRTFLPGFSFKYRKNSPLWDKLLTGKTARLIVTMDAPKIFYNLLMKKPGHNAMKIGVLEFCGVKPVKITSFHMVRKSTEQQRKLWLTQVEKLGQALA
jgi:NAD(P)H dehydrogenase (quinone)